MGNQIIPRQEGEGERFFRQIRRCLQFIFQLLKEIGGIYFLKITSMHIYFDEQGTAIAFNTHGSIFCDLPVCEGVGLTPFGRHPGTVRTLPVPTSAWVVVQSFNASQ